MTPAIVNHLWQSTIVVMAAAAAAYFLRHNQAKTRHAIWLAASLKFLLPFSMLIAIGSTFSWRTAPVPEAAGPAFVETVQTIAEPFPDLAPVASVATAPDAAQRPWLAILGVAWACGLIAVGIVRVRGWRQVLAVLRASVPVECSTRAGSMRIRSAPGLLEPGVVGIWRPVLLLPVGVETALTDEQFRAVLAHEQQHIARRDNLTSALHMVVEALFWFHPLVWWIGARLIDERERACDEFVLASGLPAEAYAEGILSICKRYVESPVACVAGVTGSDLKKRIGAILGGRIGRDLSGTRKCGLALTAVIALVSPVAAGIWTAPPRAVAQTAPVFPKVEAVSVRPCSTNEPGHGRGSALGGASPGRIHLDCYTVLAMVQTAYSDYADARPHDAADQLVVPLPSELVQSGADHSGAQAVPDWVSRDRFTVEATVEGGNASPLAMVGPVLQQVLEDRFKVRVHRETREVPVYDLVVSKGGVKVSPTPSDACVRYDQSVSPQPPLGAGQHRCENSNARSGDGGFVYSYEAITLDEFAAQWSRGWIVDRPIVNKTGLTGPFSFKVTQSGQTTGIDEARAAMVAEFRDHLGFELRPAVGRREFLLIDHVERPQLATGAPVASSPRAQGSPAAPTFDVVSVRPCAPGATSPSRNDSNRAPVATPGRMHYDCYPAVSMVKEAFVSFAGGISHGFGAMAGVELEGVPNWMNSELYTVEATTTQNPTAAMMRGPMLQAILHDRFKLTLHRETRELPVYELVAMKTGLKVEPYTGHDCVVADPRVWPNPPLPSGQEYCGAHYRVEGDRVVRDGVLSLNDLAAIQPFDRPVINRTGLSAPVAFRLEYDAEDSHHGPPGPSIVKAFRDLGIDVRAAKGPHEFIVIDHVERPDAGGGATQNQVKSR